MGKCSDRSRTGAETEAGLVKASLPSDEVASAVAAVSDEIGDILKDELGDADRADRIGAELADLSAELGLLAGLADERQQDFPSLFEISVSDHQRLLSPVSLTSPVLTYTQMRYDIASKVKFLFTYLK